MEYARLYSSGRAWFELNRIARGWVVYYLYPGTDAVPAAGSESPAEDIAEHLAFVEHQDELVAREVRVVGIASQSTEEQHQALKQVAIMHKMLADPDLALAESLNLPTFEHGGRRWYRRLTLIARDGVIQWVFYPIENAASNPGQILTWIQLHA
jgi:peroxiredoxin